MLVKLLKISMTCIVKGVNDQAQQHYNSDDHEVM